MSYQCENNGSCLGCSDCKTSEEIFISQIRNFDKEMLCSIGAVILPNTVREQQSLWRLKHKKLVHEISHNSYGILPYGLIVRKLIEDEQNKK